MPVDELPNRPFQQVAVRFFFMACNRYQGVGHFCFITLNNAHE